MPILETKNLTKRFGGVRATHALSLTFEKGRVTSIIGPNGSGKTTLINMLSGMVQMDSGSIVISGAQLKKVRPYEVPTYGITRTFQNVRVFNQMTVLDNILVILTERNVFSALFEKHKEFHIKNVENILERVGLWEKRDDLAKNLSYGQRKLLEIARAISMNASLFLLDEPFAGLSLQMIKTVVSIIKELREEERTIILVEHNMDLIRELSDYVIVMASGQLLAKGKPETTLAKREVVEAYLGE